MASLEDFLDQQLDGELQQSDAEFSLAPHLAREKLRTFQEELPCYGLLRMTQGFCSAGAQSLKFEIQTKTLEVRVQGEFPTDFLDRIKQAYQKATALFINEPDSACALACHVLQLYPLGSLTLSHRDDSWSVLESRSKKQSTDHEFSVKARLQDGAAGSFAQGLAEFKKRCRFVNAEILVNSERLRPTITPTLRKGAIPDPDHLEFYSEWVQPGQAFRYDLVAIQSYEEKEGVRILSLWGAADEDTERGPFFYGGLPSTHRNSFVHAGMAVGLSMDLGGAKPTSGVLVSLRHGVVSEARKDPGLLPGSVALLDASDLPSDLSGLRNVEGEEFEARRQDILTFMGEVCRSSQVLLPQHGAEQFRMFLKGIAKRKLSSGCLGKLFFSLIGKQIQAKLDAMAHQMEEQVKAEAARLGDWLSTTQRDS